MALPVTDTPPLVNPVTGSLKVTVKTIGPALVGSACLLAWLIVTVGGALSKNTELSVEVDARFGWPKKSVIWPAGMLATTVPLVVMPVTETSQGPPEGPDTFAERVPPAVLP